MPKQAINSDEDILSLIKQAVICCKIKISISYSAYFY